MITQKKQAKQEKAAPPESNFGLIRERLTSAHRRRAILESGVGNLPAFAATLPTRKSNLYRRKRSQTS